MKTLTILALVSSIRYRWNIKISQIFLPEKPFYDDEEDADTKQAPEDDEEESEEEESARIRSILNRGRLETFSIPNYDGQLEPSEDEDESSAVFEEPLVVNGDDTNITSVPWQASLRTNISERSVGLLGLKNCTVDEGYHFCGGSVISKRHILSATHCFLTGLKMDTWTKLSKVTIVLGDSNTCDNSLEGVQELRVEKVYFHYAYDNEALLSDVVVIKVKGEIAFSDTVKPIKMAELGMNFEHNEATVSGWGLTNLTDEEHESTPEQLQSATDLLIGNFSYCSAIQRHMFETRGKFIVKFKKYSHVFSSLLCTYVRNGTLPKVVGQGDSGGPLVVQSGNYSQEPILAGVCSYMLPIPSKSKDPHDVSQYVDFYQSVAYFRRWIDLAMQ